MFEIEAKVAISKKEFQALHKRLKKEARTLGARKSIDTYYDNPKNAYIRIRRREKAYTFDLKRRETIAGIESNIEMEWGIQDIKRWRALLKRLKIKPNIKKTKTSELFERDGFIIELNHVRLLGYFLEIETLVKSEKDTGQAKKKLVKLFIDLGYNQSQFEKRPYLELLELYKS